MENFIATIRTDRLREMREYETKGFSFIDRQAYRKIEKIRTLQPGFEMTFGVEATQNDVYFYIIDNQANTYLSIFEIYELLLQLAAKEGTDFAVSALKRQMRLKIRKAPAGGSSVKDIWLHREKFVYREIEYDIRETVMPKRDGEIQIPNMALSISYRQLFMLINLIQEKSNALFSRGKEGKKYTDGILRLFGALLSRGEDDPLLYALGWRYDHEKEQFLLEKPQIENERSRRKYYLTKQEYNTIIE